MVQTSRTRQYRSKTHCRRNARSRILLWAGLVMLFPAQVRAQREGGLTAEPESPYVVVLGTAQDGGYPQAGCRRECCQRAHQNTAMARSVVCLAIVDPRTRDRWLVECTPDFRTQLNNLDEIAPPKEGIGLSGIFLTHAHVGHYSGLIHLGREVLGAKGIPTYTMPRMKEFLQTNGPWKQMVELNNIELRELQSEKAVSLADDIRVTPLIVPHRDEFSETVAFRIDGPQRRVLFLPDIDKWDRWERLIEDELGQVDIAYLDATFFDGTELPGRDMSEIPHPFVAESLVRFAGLTDEQRGKVRFIHFNHTNPLLDPDSAARRQVQQAGMSLAQPGDRLDL